MKRASIFCFSGRGAETARRVAAALEGYKTQCLAPKGDLKALVADCFPTADALIFVGACGIAVRAVAPHLAGKAVDPAVLVTDERGEYVISLLSGHIGGANDLARRVAAAIGAVPVITTATDVNGRFSADSWAAERGLYIGDLRAAKRFSAGILCRDLPLSSDFPLEGPLPPGVFVGSAGDLGLAISCRAKHPFDETLLLIPRILHLGIGCRRGAAAEAIDAAVRSSLEEAGLCPQAVCGAASIDLKRGEPGLIAWARASSLPLGFYSADELNAVPGEYSGSDFVKQTVGVDNVCERAAMRDAGEGAQLIVKKTGLGGVTIAIAQEKWSACFE